jgi:hypothetical protein
MSTHLPVDMVEVVTSDGASSDIPTVSATLQSAPAPTTVVPLSAAPAAAVGAKKATFIDGLMGRNKEATIVTVQTLSRSISDDELDEASCNEGEASRRGGKKGRNVSVSPEARAAQNGVLRVHIKRAYDLIAKDSNGLSDPFAVVTVHGKRRFRTRMIKHTLDPVWVRLAHAASAGGGSAPVGEHGAWRWQGSMAWAHAARACCSRGCAGPGGRIQGLPLHLSQVSDARRAV